jgi:hypothetical protein
MKFACLAFDEKNQSASFAFANIRERAVPVNTPAALGE